MGNSYDSLHQVGSSPDAARASLGGGTAIVVMGVCSIVILLGVASVIFGLRRRRRHRRSNSTGDLCPSDVADIRMETPTDFMNNLASLDRCQSIDEILEKRRRAVWTLEMFESHGSDFVQSNREDDEDERGISPNSVS